MTGTENKGFHPILEQHHGYTDQDISKILGENELRVFEQVCR